MSTPPVPPAHVLPPAWRLPSGALPCFGPLASFFRASYAPPPRMSPPFIPHYPTTVAYAAVIGRASHPILCLAGKPRSAAGRAHVSPGAREAQRPPRGRRDRCRILRDEAHRLRHPGDAVPAGGGFA